MGLRGIELKSVVCVVSLLLYRDRSKQQVLLGVRRQSVTSPRHADVLSTPTMRIPRALMEDLLVREPDVDFALEPPHFARLSDEANWSIGVPYSLASGPSFAAEALICRKLGLGSELVAGGLPGMLSHSALAYDVIHDDDGGYENTLMLTMSCVLTDMAPTVPAKTPSYSQLKWVEARHIDAAVKAKDTMLLLPEVSPLEICIHGLCVRSAAFVTSGL